MRARLGFAAAGLAAILTHASASFAQPAEPATDAAEEAPDEATEPEGEAAPEALPAPEEGDDARQPGLPKPPEEEPPAAAPSQPPAGVPWYPAPAGPAAQYEPPPAEAEDTGPSRDMSRDFWQVYAGVRTSWITEEQFDPFEDKDVFSNVSVGASRALVLSPMFSFAPGLLYETGTVKSEARGADSELIVHRLGGVAEGRWHAGRDLYVLAKLVPQAIHTRAYLSEASSPEQLQQKTWRFGLDATAGAAWNFPRSLGAPNAVPQFWLVGEFGYGWAMSKDLELSPDVDEDDPQARMRLDLGPMALRGVMMRVNVALTF